MCLILFFFNVNYVNHPVYICICATMCTTHTCWYTHMLRMKFVLWFLSHISHMYTYVPVHDSACRPSHVLIASPCPFACSLSVQHSTTIAAPLSCLVFCVWSPYYGFTSSSVINFLNCVLLRWHLGFLRNLACGLCPYVNNMATAPVDFCLRISSHFSFGSRLEEASLARKWRPNIVLELHVELGRIIIL